MLRLAAASLPLLLLAIVGAAAALPAPDPTTPLASVAIAVNGQTLVAWTPGAVAPDSYQVYGEDGGVSQLLASVPAGQESALVAAGFPAYEVVAITAGHASPAAAAATAVLPCFGVQPLPPPPYVEVDWCDYGVGFLGLGHEVVVGLPHP
ncbi:MAG: hypothetical protein QOE90_3417 [Thermoplasmata archaeon]|jgi:hypothetical protein|nr:hypothetical protein [Thermoplasmata archaeon]